MLVDILTRLTFATRPQLGFDETMIRCPGRTARDNSVVYEIAVRDSKKGSKVKWYRTVRLISELGAYTIRCRGTRVWEAYELTRQGGEPVGEKTCVVKDFWLDVGRVSEGFKLDELRRKVKGAERIAFDRSFMTTLAYGDVLLNGRRPDITNRFKPAREKSPLPDDMKMLLIPIATGQKSEQTDQVTTTRQGTVTIRSDAGKVSKTGNARKVSNTAGVAEYIAHSAKIHHRIVFEEVGEPIFQTKSLLMVFYHIGQTFAGT